MSLRRICVAALVAALAAPAAASPRSAPDAHILPRPRGDVIETGGNLKTDRHLPDNARYAPPYRGWQYVSVRPGERLRSAFFTPRYRIATPAAFGLPPLRGAFRWIRYGDDLVAVDIQTGRVSRVVPGGFGRTPAKAFQAGVGRAAHGGSAPGK